MNQSTMLSSGERRIMDHPWSILRSICLVIHRYNLLVRQAATTTTERSALIVRQLRTKKITLALVTALACVLTACSFGGKEEDSGFLPSSSLMEFPGLHWNDTPEAVMETLGITEADFLESSVEQEDSYTSYSFVIGDYPLYGGTAQYAIFRFIQHIGTGHALGLHRVELCYPDDMEDFSAVRDELSRQLGPETETSNQVWAINSSWRNLLGDRYDRWVELQQQPGIKSMTWTAGPDSDAAEAVRSAEENYQGYLEMSAAWAAYLDPPVAPSMSEFEEFLEEFTGVCVTWNCNSMFMPTFNTVTFDSSEYVYCSQIFSVPVRTRNAGVLTNSFRLGSAPGKWLSYMNDLSWDAFRQAAVEIGLDDGDGTGFALELLEAVSQYIEQNASGLTGRECAFILTATDGLDGTLAERYGALVRQLHDAGPGRFAHVVLEVLPEDRRDAVLDYCRGREESPAETAARLEQELAAAGD